ncbi:MAG: Glutamate synthase [NADPH] small chain [Wolbachia endosymbiont of Ctenocephalides orientis wCori]|nr:MAG: Glutamate synthase [NADPH] small chain [Wolbachia endosymbiont of Ctenocephalides orientis wCori]
MQLNFNISFSNLYTCEGLIKLDEVFLNYIKSYDEDLFYLLIEARKKATSPLASSKCLKLGSSDNQLIIDLSYLLDNFITKLFFIEKEAEELKKKHNDFAVIYKCKRLFVQRYALRKYTNAESIDVTEKLSNFLNLPIEEKSFAEQVMHWFEDQEKYKEEIELAAQYAVWRVKNENPPVIPVHPLVIPVLDTGIQKQKMTSILFSIHKKIDHENLISLSKKEVDEVEVLYSNEIKRRYGFDLTSEKTDLNKALDNAHYCIFCHKKNKDSCSKGLVNNDGTFKKSPLKVELHGCPLEQKISEMNLVKSEGYSIASLAIVMIDNPLCAATGYRICNDCMNSCIYQKQDPVNVPMIETRTLDDVLSLPYGFEIYSLLSRWNPLNFERPLPKANTGKNVLVVGLGPAGFNLAHHLLNDGHNVVAIDGLKIEPLMDNFQPIKEFKCEKLSERIAGGFGGVAEYGITSRWDKNYLKIIRLLLERRENFAIYGGIRFGSTITVDDTFNLSFDHIALALGSGKPKMVKIKNMLARGVRMASDFLMSLQLTGALRFNSIANLQVRMPIVVIGAGLTAIDTATEALAYYPIQAEKFLHRYEILVNQYGKAHVEKGWTEEEHEIANELMSHAKLIREEYKVAKGDEKEPRILELMQKWGGVKVIYRKELKDSPSYRLNSDEVKHGLSEGIYFIENLEPVEIVADKYNHAESIKLINTKSGEIKCIKARSIFIAAGTEPNTVIATEDKEHFKLRNGYFANLNSSGKEVDLMLSPKMEDKDRILVYKQGDKAISFFGDLHHSYSGSVVKAMASAKNGYPIISKLLSDTQLHEHFVSRPFTYVSYQCLTHRCTNIAFLKQVAKKTVSSQCLTLGSSIHYSPFGLRFHEKCKNYLKAKPTGSQCRSTGMTSSVAENRPKIQYSYSYASRAGNQANKEFLNKIKEQFTARVIKVQYLTDKVVEIVIKAPLAAKNFKPGQFFRLQNFETYSRDTEFAMEAIAVTGTEVDKEKGIISTIVLETGGSSNLCKYLKEGEQIILMGPTGSPTNTN